MNQQLLNYQTNHQINHLAFITAIAQVVIIELELVNHEMTSFMDELP